MLEVDLCDGPRAPSCLRVFVFRILISNRHLGFAAGAVEGDQEEGGDGAGDDFQLQGAGNLQAADEEGGLGALVAIELIGEEEEGGVDDVDDDADEEEREGFESAAAGGDEKDDGDGEEAADEGG